MTYFSQSTFFKLRIKRAATFAMLGDVDFSQEMEMWQYGAS